MESKMGQKLHLAFENIEANMKDPQQPPPCVELPPFSLCLLYMDQLRSRALLSLSLFKYEILLELKAW
jgi:hypothetical protein